MLRNNRLSLQFFATTRQLGQMAILGIQFSSLYVLWFTGCSTNVLETTNNMKLINNTSIEQQTIQQFEKVIEINPIKVDKVVDTTGAGDLYAGGFLFGMAKNKNLSTCGHYASIAAAEIISHYGARPLVKLSSLI